MKALPLVAAMALALTCAAASAQSVAMVGKMGERALLVINGGPPKPVAPGETVGGVKLMSVLGDTAVLEINGQRKSVRVGDSPVSVGAGLKGGGGTKIVMPVGTGGHFFASGTINGKAVQFMVDTGATSIAMGAADAERIGINYKAGQMGRGSTANGVVTMYRVRLASVRIGDVEVYDVEAAVLPEAMPHILLGNSFLSRFEMRRAADQMVLERRF